MYTVTSQTNFHYNKIQDNILSSEDFTLQYLTPDHVDAIYAFHFRAQLILNAGNKGYLRDKSQKDILNHFENGGVVLALTYQGKIVGQCFLTFLEGQTAFIGGLCVDHKYAGCGLMKRLIHSCENASKARHCTKLRARVGIYNERSMKGFEKSGFAIETLLHIQAEDRMVYIVVKDLL